LIITLVFEKNANFFAETWPKSPKIGIIISNPGANPTTASHNATSSSVRVENKNIFFCIGKNRSILLQRRCCCINSEDVGLAPGCRIHRPRFSVSWARGFTLTCDVQGPYISKP
jgi:hypothetical protein